MMPRKSLWWTNASLVQTLKWPLIRRMCRFLKKWSANKTAWKAQVTWLKTFRTIESIYYHTSTTNKMQILHSRESSRNRISQLLRGSQFSSRWLARIPAQPNIERKTTRVFLKKTVLWVGLHGARRAVSFSPWEAIVLLQPIKAMWWLQLSTRHTSQPLDSFSKRAKTSSLHPSI